MAFIQIYLPKAVAISNQFLSSEEKISLATMFSVEDVNRALHTRNAGFQTVMYCMLAHSSSDCTAICIGGNKDMTMRNPYQGYMYWYGIHEFLCYGVEKGYFSVPGLSDEDGTADTESSLVRVTAIAIKKQDELLRIIHDQGGRAPELWDYYFQLPVQVGEAEGGAVPAS